MDETVAWLRERPYYEGQIRDERTVPGREATHADLAIDDRLADALEADGIERPYAHQADAIEAVRDGDNVVLATETASGKSLAYTVPAFERALDRRATTLYVAPQVALINDQTETLSDLADRLGFASGVDVAQYTGRLSDSEKRAVRDRQPTVLLTTPDMLHYGILPHARRLWDWFFERCETVVLDEVHEYRGVFGSHVALLCRRLARALERFGENESARADGDPEWVCCSATIGNPVEHAATVTGRDPDSFALVDTDTSASGPRHWLLWNPPEYAEEGGWGGDGRRRSSHVEAQRLFVDLVGRGHQTVVFTGSRQTAERYASSSADALREQGHGDLAPKVAAYQAALTDERRRELEAGLQSGDIRGVWSTSALELGVDVGGLDAVILDGYPGTRMRARQQAGRAGRGTDPALVALVAGEDQLDQYVMANPPALFDRPPEQAIANPENRQLMPAHVRCAAREEWLAPDDDRVFGDSFPDVVADLTADDRLERRTTDAGVRWLASGGGSPHHEMHLRSVEDRSVRLRHDGETIAELSFSDALRDAHPGAIYHHQGRRFEVLDLDLANGVAELDRTWADYFTSVRHDKQIAIDRERRTRTLEARPDCTVGLADVTVTKQITGYERRDSGSGELLGQRSLDLPETTLETTAWYVDVPGALARAMRGEPPTDRDPGAGGGGGTETARADGEAPAPVAAAPDDPGDLAGGLHAAEHAAIAMTPFEFLCDRRDVGGLSTPHHPALGGAAIFVYDGHPGGVGITERAYDDLGGLFATTLDMLRSCDCADGCPACVQSPHCGNGNDPLDKGLARYLLDALTGEAGSSPT